MPKIVPVHYKVLVRIFEAEGFQLARQRGDHLAYTKEGILRPVIIPKRTQVPVFIISNNLRTAGISRERYFELLKKEGTL